MDRFQSKSKAIALVFWPKLRSNKVKESLTYIEKVVEMDRVQSKSKAIALVFWPKLSSNKVKES